jgi:hypothetical protein
MPIDQIAGVDNVTDQTDDQPGASTSLRVIAVPLCLGLITLPLTVALLVAIAKHGPHPTSDDIFQLAYLAIITVIGAVVMVSVCFKPNPPKEPS